ncbi:MAG TPA: hypothetical protein VFK35_02125 [Candidatus Limnocylindrales bacterium]|nr:hypothetical protein [Candidatus Limnocylindrales bacterium]
MPRLSTPLRRHDPFWDLDGESARRARTQRRVVRQAIWLLVVIAVAFAATRLPSVDPEFLIRGDGRPLLAGALLTLLGASALLALARIRHTTH